MSFDDASAVDHEEFPGMTANIGVAPIPKVEMQPAQRPKQPLPLWKRQEI